VKTCSREKVYLSPSTPQQVMDNVDVFGFLVSPRCGLRQVVVDGACWAMDNDAFNGAFTEQAWFEALNVYRPHLDTCLFAVVPDVPYDAHGTLVRFNEYEQRLRDLSYPVAIATQNGMMPDIIPWDKIDALFVGGDDEHKMGSEAGLLIREARLRGKWIHVGRVNSRSRLLQFSSADSWDGTTICFEPQQAVIIAQTVREIRQLKGRSLWDI